MPKITKSTRGQRDTVVVKTKSQSQLTGVSSWWKAATQEERARQMIDSAAFLKEQQQYRYRQAAIYSRLYSNLPLMGWVGANMNRMSATAQLPMDRPTMNVIQSCTDTLVSRLTQSRPRPVFLTDNADYKQRNLAKQMNDFIQGEFYQAHVHVLGRRALLDAAVLGDGVLKVFETQESKVGVERVLCTELLVDQNDGLYGFPRQMYQFQLIDRSVLDDMFPGKASFIEKAEQAYPDSGGNSSKTIADQVMIVEGWHLPSGPEAKDGRHVIACSAGMILDEEWTKTKFPFVFVKYSERMLGFWGQPLTEQLMGTQVEINKLLVTISNSINLVGVPRVFVEDGSKVVSAHLNNQVGAIVKFAGTKPTYEVAPCMPAEVYAQLQRLVDYAYQQSGISALAAASQKPAGLDSGTALREYDDLQSDRFASLAKRWDEMFVELAYLVIDKAVEIAKRDGKYQTVFPSKNGTKEIDLPDAKLLEDDPFVIQAFDASSLPRDPAGRLQKIVEMIQAGMISLGEGRRLLDYPDIEQQSKLAIAAEERILKYLDMIVEDGDYNPPDPFMDLQLADQLCTQYYNLYMAANLEEDKADLLRTFSTQTKAMIQSMQAPAMAMPTPQAAPEAPAQSPMIPNAPGAAA